MEENSIFNRPGVDIYQNQKKLLKKVYKGPKVMTGAIMYRPIAISHFEIVESRLHPGKECLYAQIYRRDDLGNLVEELFITESYGLIKDFKALDEEINVKGCLGYTKIIKKKVDRSLHAVTLTGPEKQKLKGSPDGNPF